MLSVWLRKKLLYYSFGSFASDNDANIRRNSGVKKNAGENCGGGSEGWDGDVGPFN